MSGKLFIGITQEQLSEREAQYISIMLEEGADFVHVRKPGSSLEQVSQLIEQIDERFHSRLILHDHFTLMSRFNLGGVHLNGRNPLAPKDFKGQLSRSCHSLEEISTLASEINYAFLSPIFSSISKQGYKSAFSEDQLSLASKNGVINERIIALGGISKDKLPIINAYGFGGVALLGYLWACKDSNQLKNRVREIRELLDK